jgi:hypothetical protein
MHRTPQYSKIACNLRIISVPNGKWVLQKHGQRPSSRKDDPWETVSPPSSFEDAAARLPARPFAP